MDTLKKRVFLVDDHPLVRERLVELVQREQSWTVCGEAEDAPRALSAILESNPDVVVVDISLKHSHGLELVKELQQQRPGLPVLVLSMHDEALYAMRALRAGALGYVTKLASSKEVVSAIGHVMDGQIHLSEPMQQRFMRGQIGKTKPAEDPVERLTDRELEVFQLAGQGLGTRRIAEELRIGIKSVEVYRARIKEKLNLDDATELLFHAIQWVHGFR